MQKPIHCALFALIAYALATPSAALAGSLELTRPERVGMSAARLQAFADDLQRLVDDGQAAGFQVVVARRGKVVLHEAIGSADIAGGVAVTDDTLFRIYSMTKPVVGVALMSLYEDGGFSLDDPIEMHIPEFRGLTVFAGERADGTLAVEDALRPPTVHDLLTHSAGLTYGLFSDTPVDRLYRENKVLDQTRPLDELISSLADIPLLYQPGTRYHYSVAVDVQGYLIEKLSGMPLEDFVRERVLAPLNMDETMSWVPPELAARLSKIHAPGEDGVLGVYQPGESGFDPDIALTKPVFFSGGAQLISTADDYWRFGQMLLNGGVLDGVRVLSPASVKMMTSNRLPAAVPDRESGTGWGHGFNLQVATDATRINYPVNNGEFRHGGVATTIFWADPELELVVVMLSQYLPYSNPFYYDHVHRWVLPAIID